MQLTSPLDKLWSFTTGDDILSSPSVVGNVVYFGSNDFYLYALNAQTGALIWSYKTGQGVESTPTIVNGVLYVGSMDGKIYAFGSVTVPHPPPTIGSPDATHSSNPANQDIQFSVLTVAAIASIAIIFVASAVLYRQKKAHNKTT